MPAPTLPTAITALPTPPTTSDPVTFDVRADATLLAQQAMVPQVNAENTVAYNNAVIAYNAIATTATSEANASTSATNAATSKTNADTARDAAIAAQNAAAASYDSFDDRYLGAKSVAPTLDNDGAALLTGAIYFDTVIGSGSWRAWNGSAWVTAPVANASAVVNTPAGNIAAVTVQAALNELDTEKAKVGANSDITSLSAITSINSGQIGGNRNKITNPFEVNQRALTSVADDAYCVDRWYVLTESGNVTVGQVTDPESGAPWAWNLTQPDAGAKRMGLAQIIESKDIRSQRSAAMNFYMRAKPSFAGNIRYAIIEHTGAVDTVTSDVVLNWASASFTAGGFFIAGVNIIKTGVIAPGAATYGEFSDWGVFGAAMNNAILFVWTESAQAQNATLELNRPQFEPGIVHTSHEWRLNELALCQRYLPALVSTLVASNSLAIGQAYAAGSAMIFVPLPASRRIVPTGITATGTFNSSTAGFGNGGNFSTIAFFGAALTGVSISCTGGSGLVAGNATQLISTGAASILATGCEL